MRATVWRVKKRTLQQAHGDDPSPVQQEPDTTDSHPLPRHGPTSILPTSGLPALAGLSLVACGGGGNSGTPDPTATPEPSYPTQQEASRFLAQASMGASASQLTQVQSSGFASWLDAQEALPATAKRWDLLVSRGLDSATVKNSSTGWDTLSWQKLIAAPDTLRQRITMALSEIFVTSIEGFSGPGWQQFTAAAYVDLLESHAFGNYRDLLQAISLSPAMGMFLTYRGNAKANPTTGALPDENYARELLQLFTIGLVQLNLDGTPKLTAGATTDTYNQADITGLARVFTGWDLDLAGLGYAEATATPDVVRRPLVQVGSRYETGTKTFLGTTIDANTPASQSLTLALDAICAHPNVAPFFCRQLIQKLVTSNPSPAYVARMAGVFNNDGSGVRGNLRAVVRALLLDTEARSATEASQPGFGRLREPMLRFVAWARAYNATSPSGAWAIGNTSDPATALGQSPLRSPTVFNFFRPGYVPANTAIARAGLVAPEFQITNESSVVGTLNFMQRAVAGHLGDITPDYSSLLPLADDAPALLAEINLVLAANQLAPATVAAMAGAVQTMPGGSSDANRRRRIHAALVMVLAAPEFVVQR